jgi:hypothetical protein
MKINKSRLLHILGHAQASMNLSLKLEKRIPPPDHLLLLERLTEHVTEGGQLQIVDNCPWVDQSIAITEPVDSTPRIEGGL